MYIELTVVYEKTYSERYHLTLKHKQKHV